MGRRDDGFGDEEFIARQRDENRVKAVTLLRLVGAHRSAGEGGGDRPPMEQWLPLCIDGYGEFLEAMRDPRFRSPDWNRQECCGAVADDPSPASGPQPVELPAGRILLCSCGRSRHGWFCDGAHLGTGLIPRDLQLEQPTTVLMCGCGRSRRYPLCDGHHRQPAERPWWKWWG